MLDFNTAEPQRDGGGDFEPMPEGTIAPVIINVRGIKPNNAGDKQGLDVEFTITDGPFAKRRVWKWMGISGSEPMVNVTKSQVRGILESAFGINPTDESETAMQARQISDWEDLHGLAFVARIGLEKGTNGYADKNIFRGAVTPDKEDYKGFKPTKAKSAPQKEMATADSGSRPAWA